MEGLLRAGSEHPRDIERTRIPTSFLPSPLIMASYGKVGLAKTIRFRESIREAS